MENKKIKINEIIVVEGRDDITAVKRVVDGHIIALNGFSGLTQKTLNMLVEISKNNDIILLTDPDFAGKKIRQKIMEKVPNIKHCFISRKKATKDNNIGVENANDETILEALKNIISKNNKNENIFTISDLLDNGLCSGKNAKERRIMLGDILKIGYYNSKQLLYALNNFNINKNDFEKAIDEINRKNHLK